MGGVVAEFAEEFEDVVDEDEGDRLSVGNNSGGSFWSLLITVILAGMAFTGCWDGGV